MNRFILCPLFLFFMIKKKQLYKLQISPLILETFLWMFGEVLKTNLKFHLRTDNLSSFNLLIHEHCITFCVFRIIFWYVAFNPEYFFYWCIFKVFRYFHVGLNVYYGKLFFNSLKYIWIIILFYTQTLIHLLVLDI